MSQIGYMIMGVSVGAYAAGLFHLMTHAFFKALLFMAAGSLIGAMGGEQSLDKMSGFRKAMPFTYAASSSAAWRCRACRRSRASFQGRDPATSDERGGGFGIWASLGYVGALHDRDLHVPDDLPRLLGRARARRPASSSRATCYHAEVPTNPADGEVEDTDVGFPGPDHHIAERDWPMSVAMGGLARARGGRRLVQIPWVDDALDQVPGADLCRPRRSTPRAGTAREWSA